MTTARYYNFALFCPTVVSTPLGVAFSATRDSFASVLFSGKTLDRECSKGWAPRTSCAVRHMLYCVLLHTDSFVDKNELNANYHTLKRMFYLWISGYKSLVSK